MNIDHSVACHRCHFLSINNIGINHGMAINLSLNRSEAAHQYVSIVTASHTLNKIENCCCIYTITDRYLIMRSFSFKSANGRRIDE